MGFKLGPRIRQFASEPAEGNFVMMSGYFAHLCEEVAHDAAPDACGFRGTNKTGDVMMKLKPLKYRFVKNLEFRQECKRVGEECALIEALVRARAAAKLTQVKVARRAGTIRSMIVRLEGGRVSPSFATLRRSDWLAVDRGLGAGRRPRRVKLPAELAPRCQG